MLIQNGMATSIERYRRSRELYQQLAEQYNRLQVERDELLKKNIELASVQDTWDAVQELIEFKQRYRSPVTITAQVIVRNFSPKAHFFFVDAGSRRGVEKDMVAVYKNCLIGRVTEVYPFYSRITLLTDPECEISAFCPSTHFQGIHHGTAQLTSTQVHATDDKEVNEGDLFFSSGQGLVFPKGFGLGRVKEVQRENFNYLIMLEPLVDLRKLSHCLLVAKGAEFDCQPSP